MSSIIPLFSTSASLKQGGIFTVEKAGTAEKAKHSKGPISLCDLVKQEGLKQIHLVESNFVNFMQAFKNLKSADCNLAFGLKLVICDDMQDKTEQSFVNESKVVIFMKNDVGYKPLIHIYSKAATDGFYYVPRIDWKTLNQMWSENLILALPYYSSFLARNTLSFASIVPTLPVAPVLLKEIGQQLPFDDILDNVIQAYNPGVTQIQEVKSIYYKNRNDAKKFMIWRCILNRTTWDKPNFEHFSSKEFSWEAFKEIK